ncbi:MAG: hypothetical protein ACRC8Y_24590 [Chroococcales cyanobacterium]
MFNVTTSVVIFSSTSRLQSLSSVQRHDFSRFRVRSNDFSRFRVHKN